MIEPLGDAVDHRGLQPVMVQDGREDEGRELRLAPHQFLGLATDARPDRVHLVERAPGLILLPDLMLGHGPLRELVTPVDRHNLAVVNPPPVFRLTTGAAAWRPYRG